MIKLTKILMPKNRSKPKPLFNANELAIYNPSGELGNEFDELYHIKFRRFGKSKKDLEKKWYYFGSTLTLENTSSRGLPYAPFFKRGFVNTPEEHLHKLNGIRCPFY
ncbi:MAG TPA: hypothetical protein PK357_01560 [Candidatus Pacearchaeota archaeon]|nr:hypothetical protein [Candidatus Pacearchaeota archaeon]